MDPLGHGAVVGGHLGDAVAKFLQAIGSVVAGCTARGGLTLLNCRLCGCALFVGPQVLGLASRLAALGCLLGRHIGVLLCSVWGLGGRPLGGLPLLQDPDRVAERVAYAHIGPVEVVSRLLGEVGDAALLERLVQAA